MIESWAIRLEIGILVFSSVLFLNLLPESSFVDEEIHYGDFKKKRKKIFFITIHYLNIEKVSESSWDTIHGWIK